MMIHRRRFRNSPIVRWWNVHDALSVSWHSGLRFPWPSWRVWSI